jgi:sensor histidine kinase regulating citrate/malate metabolism
MIRQRPSVPNQEKLAQKMEGKAPEEAALGGRIGLANNSGNMLKQVLL